MLWCPVVPNTSSKNFFLTPNELSVTLDLQRCSNHRLYTAFTPLGLGTREGVIVGTWLERVPAFFIVTYPRRRSRNCSGCTYAPGVHARARGPVACRWSVTVVSGGAVADKLPRRLQGLSRTAVAGRRNIG